MNKTNSVLVEHFVYQGIEYGVYMAVTSNGKLNRSVTRRVKMDKGKVVTCGVVEYYLARHNYNTFSDTFTAGDYLFIEFGI